MTGSASQATRPQRLFNLKDLSILCWGLFIVLVAAPSALLIKRNIPKQNLLQRVPERNFIFFYTMGRMLNERPASELYNFELQKKAANEVLFHKGDEYTPNPYPPFVAVFFRPFARMPFFAAYVLWLSISCVLYVAGLRITARQFFPDDPVRRSLIFPLALSFFPFLWIMNGGQLAAIGFFSFAGALREQDRGHFFRSGLALSLCLYKPSLLLLFLPMLLISRRYRTLAGFAAGGIGLFLFTLAVEGVGVWSGYLGLLLSFGTAAASTHGYRILRYYMDLSSFSSLLPGGRSWLGGAVLLGGACWAGVALFRVWMKGKSAGKEARTLIWGATLTWTCVLNLYVPIYDSLVVVSGIIATAAVLQKLPEKRLRLQFTILWILILACSWVAVQVAQITGVEILTLLFALLGAAQLAALRKVPAFAS